jgi:hypothetical protein
VLVELNPGRSRREQLGQRSLAAFDGRAPQIVPV